MLRFFHAVVGGAAAPIRAKIEVRFRKAACATGLGWCYAGVSYKLDDESRLAGGPPLACHQAYPAEESLDARTYLALSVVR